jgi:beta-lactamase class A
MLAHGETLQEIADRAKPGVLGVAVCDLRTGTIQGVNLKRPFPLRSVFKAFLAAGILSEVDAGQLSLDQKVTLAPGDIADGVGPVDHSRGGVFTVRELLRAAVIPSDNSAADALLVLYGGPAKLTAWLQQKGIEGIRIDRDERAIARDEHGIPADLAPGRNASTLVSQISPAEHRKAFAAELADPRDTATPEGAIAFLVKLQQGQLVSADSTKLLLGWMHQVSTGSARLKAGIPPGAVLAHKTGTSGECDGVTLATNDIGLATLADGRTIAIAAFLTGSPASESKREALLAACARATMR